MEPLLPHASRLRAIRALRTALVVLLHVVSPPASAQDQTVEPARGSTLEDRGSTGTHGASSLLPRGSTSYTGFATEEIEILVPPGTGGLTPSLHLQYDSGSREPSWVGYGWTLRALSISRSLQDGVPSYDDAQDTFLLGGSRLVAEPPLSAPLAPGRYAFHKRRMSFQRIEMVVDSDGTVSWEVRGKDGTVSRFGINENTRISSSAHGGSPFSWLLAEREDLNGNVIRYTYDDTDAGRRHLSEIRYTLRRSGSALLSLSGSPAPDSTVDRVVRFHLEPRPDERLDFRAGFRRELTQRLARVEVEVAGDLLRRYELD